MDTMSYVVSFLEKLVNTPSPSGYTREAMELVRKEAASFGYASSYNQKGGLIIEVPGRSHRTLGLSAHVDTLEPWYAPLRRREDLKLCL